MEMTCQNIARGGNSKRWHHHSPSPRQGGQWLPKITDLPPHDVQVELGSLRSALDDAVPKRQLDDNLLIASWNIRAFGGLTKKWASVDSDSPKRDLRSLLFIAEIVSRFDVVALQEVKGKLTALRHLLKRLNAAGANWGLILTDVSRGRRGNDERMAFVFDTRRVKLSGLACELVIPDDRPHVGEGAFLRQFARTPYAVSFRSGRRTFVLVTLHTIYGDETQRLLELKEIAEWLADWANQINAWDHNLIALGDFNIDRRGDPLYDAFMSTGLYTPQELNDVPRTIFANSGTEKFYDQIAWFIGDGGTPRLSLDYTGRAGNFDFTHPVLKPMTRFQKSWRISDHFPLWVEFSLGSD